MFDCKESFEKGINGMTGSDRYDSSTFDKLDTIVKNTLQKFASKSDLEKETVQDKKNKLTNEAKMSIVKKMQTKKLATDFAEKMCNLCKDMKS